VLVEGDDINDPVSDSLRAILDGTIVLSRELANRGHYPSIDLLNSNSRLFRHLSGRDERRNVQALIELLSCYDSARDMVEIGAYREGSNPLLDRAIGRMERINAFLRQDVDETGGRAGACRQLHEIVGMDPEQEQEQNRWNR
jgi:flagellum-specific ATP synthase